MALDDLRKRFSKDHAEEHRKRQAAVESMRDALAEKPRYMAIPYEIVHPLACDLTGDGATAVIHLEGKWLRELETVPRAHHLFFDGTRMWTAVRDAVRTVVSQPIEVYVKLVETESS